METNRTTAVIFRTTRAGAVLLAAAVTAACAGAPRALDPAAVAPEPGLAAFAEAGPFEVLMREGEFPSPAGGRIAYRLYEPSPGGSTPGSSAGRPLVLIGHGFQRSLANMEGWARLIASRGAPAAVLGFIRSSWLDGNHEKNARDLRDLADGLAPGLPRVYAGFSAGGLSALIAAAADPAAVALLCLDPVDSGGLGVPAAATWASRNVPSLFLFGDASACNAEINLLEPLRAAIRPARPRPPRP